MLPIEAIRGGNRWGHMYAQPRVARLRHAPAGILAYLLPFKPRRTTNSALRPSSRRFIYARTIHTQTQAVWSKCGSCLGNETRLVDCATECVADSSWWCADAVAAVHCTEGRCRTRASTIDCVSACFRSSPYVCTCRITPYSCFITSPPGTAPVNGGLRLVGGGQQGALAAGSGGNSTTTAWGQLQIAVHGVWGVFCDWSWNG